MSKRSFSLPTLSLVKSSIKYKTPLSLFTSHDKPSQDLQRIKSSLVRMQSQINRNHLSARQQGSDIQRLQKGTSLASKLIYEKEQEKNFVIRRIEQLQDLMSQSQGLLKEARKESAVFQYMQSRISRQMDNLKGMTLQLQQRCRLLKFQFERVSHKLKMSRKRHKALENQILLRHQNSNSAQSNLNQIRLVYKKSMEELGESDQVSQGSQIIYMDRPFDPTDRIKYFALKMANLILFNKSLQNQRQSLALAKLCSRVRETCQIQGLEQVATRYKTKIEQIIDLTQAKRNRTELHKRAEQYNKKLKQIIRQMQISKPDLYLKEQICPKWPQINFLWKHWASRTLEKLGIAFEQDDPLSNFQRVFMEVRSLIAPQ